MKKLLTVLFFLDTVILIVLSFWLLKMIDHGMTTEALAFMLLAYIACIFGMGYLLFRYLRLPTQKKYHSIFD